MAKKCNKFPTLLFHFLRGGRGGRVHIVVFFLRVVPGFLAMIVDNKETLSFICFDVCDFYPSINEKLLSKALNFASKYRHISSQERDIIMHAKQSLLFSDDIPWEKKCSNNKFDVTMGSFDGAETCELVGCYILTLLSKKYGQNIGLYRDDGLSAFNQTPQEIEKIKKDLCKTFRDNDLKITIEANITTVNFLDVTLDLKSGKHCSYSKPGNIPSYIHNKSNYPPCILKNIPEAINKRLLEISLDKECFDKAKPAYQEALDKCGYHHNLTYNEKPQTRRNRPRNITWFNPPFSMNVETNVGNCFLNLIDRHFPKSNPLQKLFNRHTLKLSYSCMSNVENIITNHNKAEINKSKPSSTEANKTNCNCRKNKYMPYERKLQRRKHHIPSRYNHTGHKRNLHWTLRHYIQTKIQKPYMLI